VSSSNGASNSSGECVKPTDCPPKLCYQATCDGGICSAIAVAVGTPTPDQSNGDCRKLTCDGKGSATNLPDNADYPPNKDACHKGICTDGTPMQSLLLMNMPCAFDGGAVCDNAGNCVECNTSLQCMGGVCNNHVCELTNCFNMSHDFDEADVDCGGVCVKKCQSGMSCIESLDCVNKACTDNVCN